MFLEFYLLSLLTFSCILSNELNWNIHRKISLGILCLQSYSSSHKHDVKGAALSWTICFTSVFKHRNSSFLQLFYLLPHQHPTTLIKISTTLSMSLISFSIQVRVHNVHSLHLPTLGIFNKPVQKRSTQWKRHMNNVLFFLSYILGTLVLLNSPVNFEETPFLEKVTCHPVREISFFEAYKHSISSNSPTSSLHNVANRTKLIKPFFKIFYIPRGKLRRGSNEYKKWTSSGGSTAHLSIAPKNWTLLSKRSF